MSFVWQAIADQRDDHCIIVGNNRVYALIDVRAGGATYVFKLPFSAFGCAAAMRGGQSAGLSRRFFACDREWGVIAIDLEAQAEKWRRTELRDMYHVAAFDASFVVAARERVPPEVQWTKLDTDTGQGEPVEVRGAFCWPFGGETRASFSDGSLSVVEMGTGQVVRAFGQQRKHVLAVANGEERVFVGEMLGRVVCYDIESGKRLWLSEGGEASHCISLCVAKRRGVLLAIGNDERHGRSQELMAFDIDSGLRSKIPRPRIPDGRCHNGVFMNGGETMLLYDGYVLDVFSGDAVEIDCEKILRAGE